MEILWDSQHNQHAQSPRNIGLLFTVNKIHRNLPLLGQIKCNDRSHRFALPHSHNPCFVGSWVIPCSSGWHDFHLSPAQGESQNITFSQLIFTICLVQLLPLEFSLTFSSKLHKQSKAGAELEIKRELLLSSAF